MTRAQSQYLFLGPVCHVHRIITELIHENTYSSSGSTTAQNVYLFSKPVLPIHKKEAISFLKLFVFNMESQYVLFNV